MSEPKNIKRHDAYYRMNPSGHKELVVKKKGKRDEEILNELVEDLIYELYKYDEGVEFAGQTPAISAEQQPNERARHGFTPSGMMNDSPQFIMGRDENSEESPNNLTSSTEQASDSPELSRAKSKIGSSNFRGKPSQNKYITGYTGDKLDYGATHSESFTGTGAIAIGPGPYDVLDDEDEDEDETTEISENLMANRILQEWEPKFVSGEYDSGDYKMPSPTGTSIGKSKPKKDKVGAYDTTMHNHGETWPKKHKESNAMGSVGEDGIGNDPQDEHESSVGEPKDGHQSELSHNWPSGPKNSGNGVAEPFGGTRWADGGILQGSGPKEIPGRKGSPGMPSKGTITGTSGPQLGQPSEGKWSPDLFATMMEGDFNTQELFDNYARNREAVCCEDFQILCHAHGHSINLNEESILKLMQNNDEFIFYRGEDANGPYWVPTPLAEGKKPFPGAAPPFGKKDEESDEESDEDCDPECEDESGKPWEESRSRRGRTFREWQEYDPEELTDKFATPDPEEFDDYTDDDVTSDFDYPEEPGPGHYGMHDSAIEACPECDFQGTGETTCPECGAEICPPGEEASMAMHGAYTDSGIDDLDADMDEWDTYQQSGISGDDLEVGDWNTETQEFEWDDDMFGESLGRFMTSARNIISNGHGKSGIAIGEALNQSWRYYAGNINPNRCPSKIVESLQQLMDRFPRFNPINESGSDAMCPAPGKKMLDGGAKNKSSFLPDMDSDMSDEGEAWPRKHKTQSSPEETPILKGTAKGMSGTGNSKAVKENIVRLANKVRRSINEGSKRIKGDYDMKFTCLVNDKRGLTRTPVRTKLVEALADAEELLQVHSPKNVMLEAYYVGKGFNKKQNIKLSAIKKRGPIFSEGKAIFRFNRIAEAFARNILSEGKACKIGRNNWGSIVKLIK